MSEGRLKVGQRLSPDMSHDMCIKGKLGRDILGKAFQLWHQYAIIYLSKSIELSLFCRYHIKRLQSHSANTESLYIESWALGV